MLVEMRPIDSVTPYPGNPRLNDASVDAVAASLKEFGWQQPLVVDEADVIIVGHTRYKAAKKLGMAEVPVHVARGLTPAQARAYRIADNQTATLSQWDDDKLALELVALQTEGYDLSLTGFPEDDVLKMLTAPEPLAGDPDAVPDPPAAPVTKPGDLWVLGRHRLLCGDATKADDVAKVLGDRPADVLLTDPPYNVAYEGKTADHLTIANDELDPAAYRTFLAAALTAAGTHLRPGGAFYLFHADVTALPVRLACADAGLTIRQGLVWVKSVLVPGRQDYQWKHEPILYGWADGAAHTWLSDRSQSTVLEFDKPVKNSDHPTPKPVDLFAYLLGNSCPAGGTVLDPFAGSGTALVAAEQTGRSAALLELDPRYADVVVQRYEQLTGKTAERRAA
ncbi:adenine methyltransferase : ParB-like partition protein OS=Sutterella wadsworthensis 2_1_59BFAA GN=HMPREF9465_00225 PE=4 SV=1: ParBc: N6_N4_Mtase [Gemmataceae bacterium]|nr:adenine methyltransferase : ParB-like partition protein OS=Sutterella wadsworthensis 2_1_59BFAA GN=HMPREF9465_00225 PE=4 SV=1: ParBc: N6_N4_Mtase [Gemmataceae bacterium]VTU02484.1 adenine methyltransferase : ParB-like partition protein OS=Sutterella wadsworthensis 2_1_59BFAA GN=HMPREF9465_00225 PE=4 SV=1: ParBc: N6_N4_Mtase [Gemmataceae bacterium]